MSDVLNLPSTWVQVAIADIGKVVSGGTPSTKESSFWGGDISWISPSDLTGYSNKYISKGAKSITPEGLKKSSATIMPAGSIHFSSRAPIGYTVISSTNITTNQGFKSLVPAEGVFNEYIYYYFKSAKQLAESKATGTTFKEISGTAFSKLPIPLPPTNEQHRIVAKIEELFSKLDKGIENLKTAQAQLKVYRQALLKHAFEGKLTSQWRAENQDKLETAEALLKRIQHERTQSYQQQLTDWEASGKQGIKPKALKPLPPLTAEELVELPELPEGWGWVRLDEVSEKITDGDHQAPPQTKVGVPFITISDIKNQRIDFSDTRYVSQSYFDGLSDVRKPVKDDILYTVTGSFGIPCLIDFDREFCFQRHIGLIRSCKKISKKFLFYILSSRHVFSQAASVATGTAQKTVPLGGLRLFKIPLMSYEEQEKIANKLETCLSETDQLDQTITTSLQQAEALRQSILKNAFSGQLVPQDPHDEPASALLTRIKAEREHSDKSKQKRKIA